MSKNDQESKNLKLATRDVRFASHLLFKMRHGYPFWYQGKSYHIKKGTALGTGRETTAVFDLRALEWAI